MTGLDPSSSVKTACILGGLRAAWRSSSSSSRGMSAEVSFTKRAAAEISRCFNGISQVSRQSSTNSASTTSSQTSKQTTTTTPAQVTSEALSNSGGKARTTAEQNLSAVSRDSTTVRRENSTEFCTDHRQSAGGEYHFWNKSQSRHQTSIQTTVQSEFTTSIRPGGVEQQQQDIGDFSLEQCSQNDIASVIREQQTNGKFV